MSESPRGRQLAPSTPPPRRRAAPSPPGRRLDSSSPPRRGSAPSPSPRRGSTPSPSPRRAAAPSSSPSRRAAAPSPPTLRGRALARSPSPLSLDNSSHSLAGPSRPVASAPLPLPVHNSGRRSRPRSPSPRSLRGPIRTRSPLPRRRELISRIQQLRDEWVAVQEERGAEGMYWLYDAEYLAGDDMLMEWLLDTEFALLGLAEVAREVVEPEVVIKVEEEEEEVDLYSAD